MRRKKHLQDMSRDELIQFGQKLEEQRQRRNAKSNANGGMRTAENGGSGSKLLPAKRHFRCCTLVTAIMPLML